MIKPAYPLSVQLRLKMHHTFYAPPSTKSYIATFLLYCHDDLTQHFVVIVVNFAVPSGNASFGILGCFPKERQK